MTDNERDQQPKRSSYKKQPPLESSELWENVTIAFRLEAKKFPDNKIYGRIDVKPESSRKLIKNLLLVVDDMGRFYFEPSYENISASGFDRQKKYTAHIEAVPTDTKWTKKVKSKSCTFFFSGSVYNLCPTVQFAWTSITKDDPQLIQVAQTSTTEIDPEPILIVTWYHIGDSYANKYILHMDDEEIKHIRQKLVQDIFEVRICRVHPGDTHTIQVSAWLDNDTETCRSDPIEFTVPNEKPNEEKISNVINILNERPPLTLPLDVQDDKSEDEEELPKSSIPKPKTVNLTKNKALQLLAELTRRIVTQKTPNQQPHCDSQCNHHLPHLTYPGIEHYLDDKLKESPPSSPSPSPKRRATSTTISERPTPIDTINRRKSVSQDKRTISSDDQEREEEAENDDDDVITPVDSRNTKE